MLSSVIGPYNKYGIYKTCAFFFQVNNVEKLLRIKKKKKRNSQNLLFSVKANALRTNAVVLDNKIESPKAKH